SLCLWFCVTFFVISLFFLILRLPPTSTLFPYTTLFRSRHPPPMARGFRGRSRALPQARPGGSHRLLGRHRRGPPASRPPRPQPQDRKSTRLNSSHSQISYAVFCLKKKNTKNRSPPQNHT